MTRALLWVVGRIPPGTLRWISGLRWRIAFLRPLFERLGDQLRNRDMVIQRGPAAGLRFNTGSAMAGYVVGYMEPHIQQAVLDSVRPGTVAYDIGANVGYLSMLLARRVGPTGRVVSFEPMPANAAQVRHNARLNAFEHVTVRAEAVGERDGTGTFLVDAFATNHRLASIGTAVPDLKAEISVPIRALDSVAAELPPPQFIKMDIEGAEVMALRGGRELLRSARPILLIELHATGGEVVPLLEELGYRVRRLHDPLQTAAQEAEDWNGHILATPV